MCKLKLQPVPELNFILFFKSTKALYALDFLQNALPYYPNEREALNYMHCWLGYQSDNVMYMYKHEHTVKDEIIICLKVGR